MSDLQSSASKHLSLVVIPPGDDVDSFFRQLIKESMQFTAMCIDEHHDILSCPQDHDTSWKRLAQWACDKNMQLYLLSATAPPILQQKLLDPYDMNLQDTAFIWFPTNWQKIRLHTIPVSRETGLWSLVHVMTMTSHPVLCTPSRIYMQPCSPWTRPDPTQSTPGPFHPLSLPSHALCSICNAYVSTHDAMLLPSNSREHHWPIVNPRTRSKAHMSEHNLKNSHPCSRVTFASYDKSFVLFCIHFGFSSSRFDICTLALPFTFSLLIPGPTHSRCLPFVICSLALLYTACLYSWTHHLTLSLSYLICDYFAVFFLSSNINNYDTSHMLHSSQSLTRLSSCKGHTTASKALLRL